eukprot:6293491-Alexandrium_andersonii.AAC.1
MEVDAWFLTLYETMAEPLATEGKDSNITTGAASSDAPLSELAWASTGNPVVLAAQGADGSPLPSRSIGHCTVQELFEQFQFATSAAASRTTFYNVWHNRWRHSIHI